MARWLAIPAGERVALLRRTMIHESAHAVVGIIVGAQPLIEVTIGLDERGWAVTTRASPFDGNPDDGEFIARVVRSIVSVHAGLIADERQGIRDWRPAAQDLRLANEHASWLAPSWARDSLLDRLRAVSREAVHDGWGPIEAVAAALLDRYRLTGDEVDAIVPRGWLRELHSRHLAAIAASILPVVQGFVRSQPRA